MNLKIRTAITIATCLLSLGVVNALIAHKQDIVDSGETVFLELAPVDPRSLMQGDYMQLNYALSRGKEFNERMTGAPTRGRIALQRDGRGVGRSVGLFDGTASPDGDLIPLHYRKWRRGWKFGIESFFFEEGQAETYAAAKFAEIRISPGGTAVLVDLRGSDLEPLVAE
jgi:uncharacterized membrane-anchored protein